MFFASDNGSGVAPEVMAALAADSGYARPYGADEATAEVTALVRAEFEAPEAEVVLVASGTAANALALSTLCPPWGVVFCREEAHVAADECNAAEFFRVGPSSRPFRAPTASSTPRRLRRRCRAMRRAICTWHGRRHSASRT